MLLRSVAIVDIQASFTRQEQQQGSWVVEKQQKARFGRIDAHEVARAKLHHRLSLFAIVFVEPEELLVVPHDQPAVEQKHLVTPAVTQEEVQVNFSIGQTETLRRLVTSCMLYIAPVALFAKRLQVEDVHEAVGSRHLLRRTQRHQMMLIGHYPPDLILRRHTQDERVAQRV